MRDAAEHNEQGRRLLTDGELDAAAAAFRASARAAPGWSVPWFNLGLCHKRARRWAECTACNEEAVARDPGDEGAWWNLGISATALGDWVTAGGRGGGWGSTYPTRRALSTSRSGPHRSVSIPAVGERWSGATASTRPGP